MPSVEGVVSVTSPIHKSKALVRAFSFGAVMSMSIMSYGVAQDASQPVQDAPLAIPETKALNLDEPTLPEGPTQEALQQMVESEGGAVFRGLDKITARVSTVYAPIDEMVT